MIKFDKKINKIFEYWLTITLLLVFSTIIIGGLTRLTDSGLSITKWELFTGIIPPLNESDWLKYFSLYKMIPQYELINKDMSLEDFKIIYYWEYLHRVIGRIIGLFFLIPLLYFHFSKKIEKKYMLPCYFIFILIVVQGIVGWYMVKSGLVNEVTVSHYRLSLHLLLALIIISTTFWVLMNKLMMTYKKFFIFNKENFFFLFLIFLIFFQVVLGAFVSGLDAGKIYQTWPMMGQSYFPNDFVGLKFISFFDFNNHSLIQFYHRNMAYILSIYIIFFSFFIYDKSRPKMFIHIILINIFLILQISLGILTLVSNLNIYIASAHQITSVLLVLASINLYYRHIK